MTGATQRATGKRTAIATGGRHRLGLRDSDEGGDLMTGSGAPARTSPLYHERAPESQLRRRLAERSSSVSNHTSQHSSNYEISLT
jgi:hypothetical protein